MDGFITAVSPSGQKRRVPRHYLDNPAFGYKLPPSAKKKRVQEPATPATDQVQEPATPETTEGDSQ